MMDLTEESIPPKETILRWTLIEGSLLPWKSMYELGLHKNTLSTNTVFEVYTIQIEKQKEIYEGTN